MWPVGGQCSPFLDLDLLSRVRQEPGSICWSACLWAGHLGKGGQLELVGLQWIRTKHKTCRF